MHLVFQINLFEICFKLRHKLIKTNFRRLKYYLIFKYHFFYQKINEIVIKLEPSKTWE